MLIECRNAPITVDKQPFIQDLRLNIQGHQMRLKAIYVNGDSNIPIDLVVYKWSVKLDKFQLCIIVDTEELTTKTSAVLKLSYDVLKQRATVSGNIGDKHIKKHITGIKDFLEIPKAIMQSK